MRVLFDAEAGWLRLAAEPAEALLAWAEGREVDSAGFQALTEAGVMVDDRPHPGIADAVGAIAAATCLITIQVTHLDGGHVRSGAGWMAHEGAAMLVDCADELVELVGMPPMLIPAVLARIVELSPRPMPPAGVTMAPRTLVDRLFDPEQAQPTDDLSAWSQAGHNNTQIAAALAGPGTRHWEVSVHWPQPFGTMHTGTVEIIDTQAGLWTVTDEEGDWVTLGPATATTVWRLIIRQFPQTPTACSSSRF